MAGDWMKVEKVTPDKPEIDAMATALSMDPDSVFVKCFRVWCWFDDHTVDGNAPSVTKSAVDRRAGSAGFADSMEKVGWLVSTPDGVSLPRFDRHNGETAKQRALTAKRVASHKRKGNADTNGPVTIDALPREEKRREENPPPPTPAPAEPAEGVDAEWDEAAVAVLSAGVGTAFDLVEQARDRGCEPVDVRRVLSHWRNKQPAWNEGGLAYRLKNLLHGQDPAEPNMWPPPSEASKAVNKSAERAEVAANAAAQRAEAEDRLAADRERLARLELKHGASVNAMDRAAMEPVLDQRMRGWRKLYTIPDKGKSLPKGGAVRFELLSHFASAASRPSPPRAAPPQGEQ